MRIAIASEGDQVAGHFGHCSSFKIYDLEDGRIRASEDLENPGHKPGFLPNYLNDRGVDLVVSGGMGQGAVDIFKEKNIEVVTGAQGRVEEVLAAYMEGRLQSTGSVCNRHEHRDQCGGHKEN